MEMKKALISLAVMMTLATAAQADDYPFLAFQTADGTVKTVSVTSLTLTFSNGQVVASNGTGVYSFPLADLSKMFFTSEPTAIKSPLLKEGQEKAVEVFSLTGVFLGRFDSLEAAQEQLAEGVYVARRIGDIQSPQTTFKLMSR